MITSISDLEVFNLARTLAKEVFYLCKNFPKEENYSLTDQLIRAVRSLLEPTLLK
ncbi:MAG: hypothetical protein C4329_11300 [Chitinophagaceae bacterium]